MILRRASPRYSGLGVILLTFLDTSYQYTVAADGTFENRKLFAYVSPGIPDGIHCDTAGNGMSCPSLDVRVDTADIYESRLDIS